MVLRDLLIKNLFHCGTDGQSLIYMNSRLQNRSTCLEWDNQIVGPIDDQRGLEQGGVNSGDFYKIFSKEQLHDAQASELGVPLGDWTISAIGQADDTLLVANSLPALQNLLQLTLNFCSKYHVKLCADKTKLQVCSTKPMRTSVQY